MHTPYSNRLQRVADFRVRYRFLTREEGGRKGAPPYQGYRSDFWYLHPDHRPNQIFMIWPEFLDEQENVILVNDASVPSEGLADMWLVDRAWRNYHRDKIKAGTVGYFMEGPHRVAICTVFDVSGLYDANSASNNINP